MCGATPEQKTLQASQAKFYDEMTANYKAVFGQSQAILGKLTAVLQPIVDKGPNQRGFSPEARTAIETGATENLASNFNDAKVALQEARAARGGNDFIPSGADLAMDEDIDAMGASQRSSTLNQIEQADWNLGRQNWQTATTMLGGVAQELNPNGTSSAATGAGEAAGTTANQIAQASNSMWGAVIGGLSGIAGQAVGGWTGSMGKKAGANG